MRARHAAVVGVVAAVAVGALAFARRQGPTETRAVETTVAIRIVRRDRIGLPEKKGVIRDPARVRAFTEALGVDIHAASECPSDYAEADLGVVLSGRDVYARRNVYVFGMFGGADADADAGTAPSVVSVTSAGCRAGAPADVASLRRELRAAGIADGSAAEASPLPRRD